MSWATTDPTLDALVPRSTALRSAALAGVCLAVLVAAWFLPTLLRPAVGSLDSGMSFDFPDEGRVVQVASVSPHGLGGVQVSPVDDVPGARIVAAWLVDGQLAAQTAPSAAPETDGVSALQFATGLAGIGDGARLPRTVPSGHPMTLVVLWRVDDCVAANGRVPSVVATTRWGATRVDYLHFSPFHDDGDPDGADVCWP